MCKVERQNRLCAFAHWQQSWQLGVEEVVKAVWVQLSEMSSDCMSCIFKVTYESIVVAHIDN